MISGSLLLYTKPTLNYRMNGSNRNNSSRNGWCSLNCITWPQRSRYTIIWIAVTQTDIQNRFESHGLRQRTNDTIYHITVGVHRYTRVNMCLHNYDLKVQNVSWYLLFTLLDIIKHMSNYSIPISVKVNNLVYRKLYQYFRSGVMRKLGKHRYVYLIRLPLRIKV
jgi:hypothetical protein